MSGPTIGIVGGQGRMGAWFKDFFAKAGFHVLVADLGTDLTPPALAERSEVVVLSVPIAVTEEVAREVGPRVREDGLLMDLTSNKTAPLRAMLESSRCEVVGAHPLFGPREDSIRGRRVVLCKGRGERWFDWLKTLLEGMGAVIRVTTPEHHDRLMSAVQGLTHLNTLALAAAVRELGFDPEELDAYATTSFSHLRPQITRTLRQDAQMIASILTLNPEVLAAVTALEDQIARMKRLVEHGDFSACSRLIQELRGHFRVEPEGLN